MTRSITYHIRLGRRRTTVSVDTMISTLLSLKFDQTPETPEAHAAVCEYLQKKIDENKDPGRIYVSQWLREESVLDLVDKNLSNRFWKWIGAAAQKKRVSSKG